MRPLFRRSSAPRTKTKVLVAAVVAAWVGIEPCRAAGDGAIAAPKAAEPKTAAPATVPATPLAPSPAPFNGATAIDETYGDWTVGCRVVQGKAQCGLSQAQGDRQSGRQVFAIQLQVPSAGTADGTIIMPFGLRLDAGAILKLDGKDLGQGVRFSTCVSQGCLLPVSLPGVATEAIGRATSLTVSSLDLQSGNPVTFKVSTNGFKTALDRVTQLAAGSAVRP